MAIKKYGVSDTNAKPPPTRGQLIRHVLEFQFKLALDSLSHLLVGPLSLIAALAGILTIHRDPSRYFDQVLQWGHRFEQWINLFSTRSEDSNLPTADDFVRKAESIVRSELGNGAAMPKVRRSAKKPENHSLEKDDQDLAARRE